MQVLKEIHDISLYRPQKGVLFEIYQMLLESSMPREKAVNLYLEKGHTNFKVAYKKLKDKLLDGVLQNSFSDLTKVQRKHIEITKKYTQSKVLYKLEKRKAGVKIAEETIRQAEQMGLIEIALSLSRDMEMHYATQFKKAKKYNYYEQKTLELKKAFDEEFKMQKLYIKLLNADKNNRPLKKLFFELNEMKTLAENNQNYRFRLFYYQSINRMADKAGDVNQLLKNTETAITFFNNCKSPLPYTTRWIFQINLIPIYIQNSNFLKAERTLNECLTLPNKGTFNWHLTLLYKALYGFYTNKPQISLLAYKEAHSIPKKFDSPLIEERWMIVEGYLLLYNKWKRVHYPRKIKLYKYLNSIEADVGNRSQKANLVVLELLHLFSDNKINAFTKKTWLIDNLISNNFNKYHFRRTKYFLRSVRTIVDGHFHPASVARHATKHLLKLKKFKEEIELDLMDKEVVPYEFLWTEILNQLKAR